MDCSSALFLFLVAVGLGIWLRSVSERAQATEARLEELAVEVVALRQSLARRSAERAPAPPKAVEEPEAAQVPAEPEPERIAAPPESAVGTAPPPAPAAPLAAESEPALEPPPPAEPVSPVPPPARRIDWERWLGVRGAAVLGAAALALAGFLFLKLAIERGLIPPAVRVTVGLLAGLASIVGSELLRRRVGRYDATANALAGAGIVLLYGAVWAARALYGLIPGFLAFVLMALVTAACGALSWRYGSVVIAVLGLLGGFATPALLSTGEDRPIALFGYLLLLDAGLLVLAARRRWPTLAAVSLGLTVLYQGSWIFARMDAGRALLGLGILGLFALVYTLAGRAAPGRAAPGRAASGLAAPGRAGSVEEGRTWRLTQAGAVLMPFAFAFYFAGRADLGGRLVPLAALLLLLSALALWLGRVHGQPLAAAAAAAADVAVVTVWSLQRLDASRAVAWELAACALVLALLFYLVRELAPFFTWLPSGGTAEGEGKASLVAAGGFLLLLVFLPAGLEETSLWPWLAGWLALAALLWHRRDLRQGNGEGSRLLAALGLGLGFGAYYLAHPSVWPVLFCALAVAAGLQALGLAGRDPAGTSLAGRSDTAAATMPLVVLILLLWAPRTFDLYAAVTLGFGFLAALAATRLRSGGWYLAAVGVTALGHGLHGSQAPDPAAWLAIEALAVVLFTAWPFLAGDSLRAAAWAWRAAALAGPAWFLPLKGLFESTFGDAAIGLLPVALGALSLAAAFRARQLWSGDEGPDEAAAGRSRLAWFAATALGFVSVAIPLQLEKEWITLGWALEGLAVTLLWRRLEHPGLKFFGLALLAAATARLVANPALLGYYPRSGLPVFNWLLYSYLVPAAALIATAAVLFRLEVARHRAWERRLFGERPAGAVACSLAAILVVFVWINLTIFDTFSTGERLQISIDRLAARDLTMSLAWIVYALVLLALGMARASRGLRWISLGFLVLAIGKVFLYDLGELDDLYRVASLLGLAVSLILVSLAYQRFVFSTRGHEEDREGEES